ncbi:MAG: redox-regulated ATPase YchF [Candidatus Bathyarchaeia archaeon]
MIRIGIIGKTNTGKTTFFNSATSSTAEISTYPFTTKKPNMGIAYVSTLCVCGELNVKDNPKNSMCVEGWRFIPIELIDLPGLIRGAWKGRGLGTQFLSVAAQADVLLHIVDASGSVDEDGNLTRPGLGNPVSDVYDIEEELVLWFSKNVEKGRKKVEKLMSEFGYPTSQALEQVLAGIKVRADHIEKALSDLGLEDKALVNWNQKDCMDFSRKLREYSKPTILIANKMDLAPAESNYDRLRDEFKHMMVIPVCSEAELALRRAEEKGFIKYVPGEEDFKVLREDGLTTEQKWALNYVQRRVLSKWLRTGVQFALNMAVFKLLRMNTVYPVEDPAKLSDKRGNVLPDVFLVSPNSTARDLAAQIHSELAKKMIYAVDARTGLRLPVDYVLRDRDVINIVSAARK